MASHVRRRPTYGTRIGTVILIACSGCYQAGLNAQVPYQTGAGSTSVYGYFDPLHPSKAPMPVSGVAPSLPAPPPALPTIPLSEYVALKAASLQSVQANFPSPPQVQVSPPVSPRAPNILGPLLPAPTYSWQGIIQPQTGTFFEPPTPDLAVGPSDALMVVNSNIAQFTKSGTMVASTNFSDWFNSVMTTICPSGVAQCLIYDPVIRYDQFQGRFLFLAAAHDLYYNTAYLLLSVSNGATYNSGWKIWALDVRLDGSTPTSNWGDSWRLGFDNLAVYLSGNMFSTANQFQYGKIRVIKKSDLYNSGATTIPWQDVFNLQNADGTKASSISAVHQRGQPTSGTAALFVNASDANPATYLTVWKITDPMATPLAVTINTITGLWPYQFPAVAPQLGGSIVIDAGDSRVLKAVYRNGFLYTARDSGYPGQTTTVTFDVIDTSSMLVSTQSRILNSNSFYPSFDVPPTVGLGMPFVAADIAAGTTTSASGTLTYASFSNVKAGEAYYSPQNCRGTFGVACWGDYFGGAVDPVTGGLWVSGEYAKPPLTSGLEQWGTWAAYYPWLTPSTFSDVPSTSFYADYINVLRLWGITLGCGANPPTYCPTDQVTREQMAAFIIRAIVGSNFTYTTTPYFTDVPTTDPFFSYVQKLRDLGITTGCTATTFCPGGPVTRADAAAFLVRSKMQGLPANTLTYPATPFFTDVPAISPSFTYVQKLYELGITSGCGVGLFCPGNALTRQEMAVFLTRAFLN